MKKKISLKLLAGITMLSAFAVIAGSVAWFIPLATVPVAENKVSGSSSGAYFAYGNGIPTTAEHPENRVYGITTARHLYNLAWLQYLGFFNLEEENGKQYYFELADNIDMTGWTLPPIGTEEYPFIGNFNGNGYVVHGLTVSNKFSDFERHPGRVSSSNFEQPHILGFFGVIGDYNDDAGSAYTSAANEFSNTGLTGLTIKTYLKDSLMGIAAGYVDANMKNIAVDSSTITLDSSISQTTTSYGGFTNNISDFSLVGYTTNKKQVKKVDETIYDITVSADHEFSATEQGDDAQGWGGSIPMTDIFNDLSNYKTAAVNAGGIQYPTTRTVEYNEAGAKIRDDYGNYVTCTDMTGKEASSFTNYSTSTYNYYNYEQTDGGYVTSSYSFVNYDNNNFTCLTGERDAVIENAMTTTTTSYVDIVDLVFYFYRTVSGTTHYLTANGTTISDSTTQAGASQWLFDGMYISLYENSSYYLNNTNGTLSLGTSANTTWTYDSDNSSFMTYNGTSAYFLYFENNNWIGKSSTPSGYYITDGNDNFLTYNNSYTPANATSQSSATRWTINNQNYLCTTNRNGQTVMLGYYGSNYKLDIDTSEQYPYVYDGQYLKATVGSTTYYAYYNGRKWDATTTATPIIVIPVCNTKYSISFIQDEVTHKEQQTTTTTENAPLDLNPTFFPLRQVNGVPQDTNTGYLVSGGNYKVDQFGDIRFGRFRSEYLPNKLNTIYTIESNAGTSININNSRIVSDPARNEVFTKSKTTMQSVLNKSSSTDGLHFVDAPIKYGGSDSVFVPKAVINKNVYYNYELPQDCIDFNLKEKGYINFFAGSYFSNQTSGTNNSFFTLHEIQRGSNPGNASNPHPILGLNEIVAIYTDGVEAHSYVYEYKTADASGNKYSIPFKYAVVNNETVKVKLDGTTYVDYSRQNSLASGYNTTPIFKSSWIGINSLSTGTGSYRENGRTYTITTGYAYYFDIAMNAGEYALGSVPDGGVGAYLMYLDIGANASKYQRTIFTEHFSCVENIVALPVGVALVSLPQEFEKEIPVAIILAGIDYEDSVCVEIKGGYTNSFAIDRNAGDVTLSRSNQSNAPPVYSGEEITLIHDLNDSTSIPVTPISTQTKDIKRLTYFDVNVNLGTMLKTVITDTSVDNGTPVRTIVQTSYNGTDPSEEPGGIYIYDSAAGTDQRDSMKIYNTSNGVRYTSANLIDQTFLPIGTVSNTAILTVRIIQSDGSGYAEDILLEASIDTTNVNGKYYKFDDYVITITPDGADVVITVKSYSSGKVIYYGSTQVTAANQVITIEVE